MKSEKRGDGARTSESAAGGAHAVGGGVIGGSFAGWGFGLKAGGGRGQTLRVGDLLRSWNSALLGALVKAHRSLIFNGLKGIKRRRKTLIYPPDYSDID